MAEDFWARAPAPGGDPDISNWARLAEQMAGLGYWRLDVATRAISWSDGLFALYGLEVGDLPDLDTAMDAIHPDDSQRSNARLKRAMELGEDYTDRVRLRRADGSWRVVASRAMCQRDPSGTVATVFGLVMDVTDLDSAGEALRSSEARYRLLAENGKDLIVQCDLDNHITYISPAAEAVTGFTPAELIGRSVADIIEREDLAALAAAVEEAIAHPGRSRCVEYRIRSKDGAVLWLEARPTPLVDPSSGEIVGVTDVVRDISERKALEIELRAKCEEAQAATRAKAEFLANMSHEIRTPLTAIMGFAGLVEGSAELPASVRAHVAKICAASEQLMGVVNDVLDFSRLDARQVVLDPQPFDPAAFVTETVELLAGQAAAKGLELGVDIAAGPPPWVSLDAGRLRQVLLNLAGNAIKFTAQGKVTVALARHGRNGLKFTVVDTGPGIAPELQHRLFERFSQVDGSISRDHGGTGLGLSISKGLVELMGGAIGFRSAPGHGSSFWFTVPAPPATKPRLQAETDESAATAPAHILVVDDLAVNRQLVRAMLEPLGHTFEEAASGSEAVSAAMQRRFDLILMDLQMPGMDGLDAARAIRATAEINHRAPIVALSANVLAEHVADCRAAGMDDHLAKPIVPAALVATVAKWSSAKRPIPRRAAA